MRISSIVLAVAVAASLSAAEDHGNERPGKDGNHGDRLERLKEEHPELYARIDKDGNGEISQEEREAAREWLKKHRDGQNPGERRKEFIEKFDTDGDGKLSDAEREVAQTEMRGKLFDKIDSNGDGVISREEFMAHEPEHRPPNKGNGRSGGKGNGEDKGPHKGKNKDKD